MAEQKALSIKRSGEVHSLVSGGVREGEGKIGIGREYIDFVEINEVDYQDRVSIKRNGTLVCKQFVEA